MKYNKILVSCNVKVLEESHLIFLPGIKERCFQYLVFLGNAGKTPAVAEYRRTGYECDLTSAALYH